MTDKKTKFKETVLPLATGIFAFSACFAYLWFFVDPKIIFHGGGKITNYPVFFKDINFFLTFLSRPGGLAEYLAALLSQALFYSLLGAAVLTATGAAMSLTIRSVIKSCSHKVTTCLWLLPTVLLTIIYSRYSLNLVTTVALLMSLAFLSTYLKINTTSKAGRLIIFAALSIILYALVGGAFLIFAVSAILYDLFFRKDKTILAAQLLLATIVPYAIGFTLASQTMIDAYTSLLPFNWKIIIHEDASSTAWLMYLIYLIAPIAITAAAIINKKPAIIPARLTQLNNSKPWLISTALLLIAAAAVSMSFDKKNKLLFQCDYYSYYQDWDKVITTAKKNLNSLFLGSAATRALYHKGQLFDRMFEFYQFPTVLFMKPKGQRKLFWKQADIYFDLGYINLAEQKWTGCLDAFGERPMILKRLAWINMVKDNPASAKIYLNSLKRTFFFNDFADKYLDLLNTDPDLLTDEKVQQCRKMMIKKDYSRDFEDPEIAVTNLLQSCSDNQMAYEYMMAWFLLTKQLDLFSQRLNYMKFYDYSRLPQCFEDASLIYQTKTGKKPSLSGPLKVTPQAQQRFKNFSQICSAYQSNEAVLINQLKPQFGNSYLFYFLFSRSGMKQ